ncbi:hypothetical protein FACS189430_11630 [Bacteroidia bacterium]|nr:hypothetical protein FACS189430_11630 [Bacteroidia bacterium]
MATSVKTRKTAKPAAKRDANGRFVSTAKPAAKKKPAGVAGTDDQYMLWKDIQKQYPDYFVLLENPVFSKKDPMEIEKGIFLYKSKDRGNLAKEIHKRKKLRFLVEYTGGELEKQWDKMIMVL